MRKIFLLMLILLTNCTSPIYQIADKTPQVLPVGYGYMVGSFTSTDPKVERGLGYQNTGSVDKISGLILANNLFTSTMRNNLFIFALPAGNYEFYKVSEWTTTENIRSGFSVPFIVETGKVNYVGNIDYVTGAAANAGKTTGGAKYFVITDKSTNDIPNLKAQYPYLDMNNAVLSMPKSGNVSHQIIQFK